MNKKLFKELLSSVQEMMEIRAARKENRAPKCVRCGAEMEQETVHISPLAPTRRYRCRKCEGG